MHLLNVRVLSGRFSGNIILQDSKDTSQFGVLSIRRFPCTLFCLVFVLFFLINCEFISLYL